MNLPGQSFAVSTLELISYTGGSGTAQLNGAAGSSLTVTGTMTWVGGTMSGFGTLDTPTGATANLGDGSNVTETLDGVELRNAGTAILSDAGNNSYGIALDNGAGIDNQVTGSFTIGSNVTISSDGSATYFTNAGSLSQPASASGSTIVQPAFTQTSTGSTSVQGGEITLQSTATNAGTVTVASGASLGVGSYTQTAGSTVLNGGTIDGTTPSRPTPYIREFSIPTPNANPVVMEPGPDGNVWFVESTSGTLTGTLLDEITPAGRITEIPTPVPVYDFAFGPDGNMWFSGTDYIGEMTRAGVLLQDYHIPSADDSAATATAMELTLGPDGNIWYTEPYVSSDIVGRLTPSGQITEFRIPFDAADIITGPDGNLWFDATGENVIGRITPAGVVTIFNDLPNGGPYRGLTSGPNGNLWFTAGRNNTIVEIDTAGQLVAELPVSGSPYGMTLGPDGNLWYDELAANNIGRMTPQGVVTEFPVPTPNSGTGIPRVGPDGNIWFTEYYPNQIGEVVLNQSSAANGVNINGGALTGTGTINANVTNGGQVNPGGTDAAGTLTINGNYTQTTTGTLNVNIGGTTAGSQYGQLAVSGTAALGGTVNVALINGFQPALGNTFQPLTFASYTGNFGFYNGIVLGNRLLLDPALNPTNLTLTVQPAVTTTTLAAPPSPSVSGQSVSFTAMVTVALPPNTIDPVPTGTVTFYDNGTQIGTGMLSVASGQDQASLSIATLSTASHSITATYTSGDTNFIPSPNSTPVTQVVNKANTSTTVATSGSPSVSGQAVTFTATVNVVGPGSTAVASPTGTVTFYDNGISIGTGALSVVSGHDVATFTTSTLSTASHPITAAYTSGDGNFSASPASTAVAQVVNKASTSTAVATSVSPSVSGQAVTFTATVSVVSPGSTAVASPTGTVTFYDNGSSIGTGTLSVVSGQDVATLTTSTLSTSSHPITAAYTSGDGNFSASPASSAATQFVNKASTSTTVATSSSPSVSGQAVTFTATVSVVGPGSTAVASPTGTVTFYDNGTSIGTGTLSVVSGHDVATLTTTALSTANHPITAAYTSGDGNFNASPPSTAITQVVNKASTITTVVTSVSPSVSGQAVTFTATVSVVGPGSTAVASPTGTVTFYENGTSIGSGALSVLSGHDVATFATSTLSTASHPITAAYTSGDGNFNASPASAAITQVVNKDSTTTLASASPSYANVGQLVTFTATVSANAPGSGTPTGAVDFFDTTTNTNLTPSGVALSSGTATFATTALQAGIQTITVTYSGDSNLLTSSGSTGTVTIGQSIIVLDPTAGGALSLSGNASIKLTGGVFVDSSSTSALSASGNAAVKASVIDVHGGVQKSGNASFSPTPTTGAAVLADPLAGLPAPVANTLGLTTKGSLSLSGNSSQTIVPGVYSQITVSGNAKLTLSPGIYIITGGGFTVSGNASVSGAGVMIYNAGSGYSLVSGSDGGTYGSITLSGNGSYNLSPPTTGTYAGIVIFQARDNTKALTLSGNASGMTGTIYAPAAQLAESGNAQLNAAVIVDTMTVSGNGVNNAVTLDAPNGTVAYTPAQIGAAYGISALGLDGTGQTIAIVDAYDDPMIFQALDAFDAQFGLTASGPTLYQQYEPASSFLTVLNQNGQATSLPSTDPNGPGTNNWELEEALDVEWAHAIAPGAQIILVEASSQSLADLMAGVATAAHQPGVSMVSMSWGFPEGQAVCAADEAAYDNVFNVPGVTFVASTGDYGAADPEYPAYSPSVVAVGGTSLTLNADGSYDTETGWGYYSSSVGALIASGGGISLYEPEPAYQQSVQSTGGRTTPDVSLVADPATGAWIADTYNLDPSNPFQVVGGTSLSAPAWAGLLAVVDQGRSAAGEPDLNSASPVEVQQALYSLPQSDYNTITSGNNGYSASAGYNLVTGLGTPVASSLVPDLIAYQGPGTTYSRPTAGPLQNSGLVNTGTGDSGPMDIFSVFDSFTVASVGQSRAHGKGSNRVERALGYGTYAAGRASRPLANFQESSLGASVLAAGDGLAQPSARPETVRNSVVDQVLGALPDTKSRDALIGDLAFEQVASGVRKPLSARDAGDRS